MKTMKIKDLARGKTFHFAGQEWIKLGPDDGGILVVMADILKLAAFDEDGSADWRVSSSRKYLNGEFYEELKAKAGPAGGNAIMEATINLTADDGTNRVTSTDHVFLLTATQYRHNRDILEPLSEWWWTLTRWSASRSYLVRFVGSDGTLNYNYAYGGYRGLRPALLLDSDLLISVNEPDAEDKLTPEVAGEVMRDMVNTFGIPAGVTSEQLAAGVSFLLGMLRGDVELADREAPHE